MRFIPTSCLRTGMCVGRTIYQNSELPYLLEGTKLTDVYIDYLRYSKFAGLYIDDDLSKDIEIVNVINDDLRNEAIKSVKKLFVIEKKNSGVSALAKAAEIRAKIDSIIDELLANRDVMVNMIDLKSFDNYTYAHSVNVAILSLIIGIAMDLDRKCLGELGLGSIMHDIGKVFVAKEIVNKCGELTDDEFDEIKTHSFKGYKYARDKYKIPITSYVGILDHHEKWNGSGYPNGTIGNSISLFGRIITVADIYDALTTERSYRPAMSPSEAMEYIIGNSGVMFDPNIVDVFRKKIAPYPIGTVVILSNGYTALVIENYEELCLRPKVRLIYDQDGNPTSPRELDLRNDYELLSIVVIGLAASSELRKKSFIKAAVDIN